MKRHHVYLLETERFKETLSGDGQDKETSVEGDERKRMRMRL